MSGGLSDSDSAPAPAVVPPLAPPASSAATAGRRSPGGPWRRWVVRLAATALGFVAVLTAVGLRDVTMGWRAAARQRVEPPRSGVRVRVARWLRDGPG